MKRDRLAEEQVCAMEVDDRAPIDPYFEGYMRPSIHRLMLSDGPRMASYRAAIQRMDLRGKTVLDVGAGTGLLALWCARQGAARVVAVEASPMARVAREIVEANGLGGVVEVHECRVEELQLPRHSVHVIVSEWMGFHLVNESMLDSVLAARDALLAPGGRMLPGAVRLLAAPVQCDAEALFWADADKTGGFDMTPVMRLAIAERCAVPSIELVPPSALLAAPQVAAAWDLHGVSREEARTIHAQLSWDTARAGTLTGLALWFDCDIGLDCGPHAAPTHWKQTVVSLPEWTAVEARQPVGCELRLEQDPEDVRSYSCSVLFSGFAGHELDCECLKCQLVRGE